MKLEHVADIIEFDPYNADANNNGHGLGEQITIADQRAFRFFKADANTHGTGKLSVAPAPKTNHHNMAWASGGALQATSTTFTMGATAAVADEYDEGYLIINAGTGVGYTYKVRQNPAANSGATVAVATYDPILVTLGASSKGSLSHNTYNGSREGTTGVDVVRPAGVVLNPVPASNYSWVQTKGLAGVLADGTIAVGSYAVASTSVAGATKVMTSINNAAVVQRLTSFASTAGVDTEYRQQFLVID